MNAPNFKRTRFACYFSYLAMASVFVLPAMLFTTFHELYKISYTLLGTLVLVNFVTQMTIDLIFTFFSRFFNMQKTVRVMPLFTTLGLLVYAIVPALFPQYAFWGLVIGTIIFSLAAGLSEVLLSPVVAAIPSDTPEKDMSTLHSLYGWGVVSTVAVASLYFWLFGTENWLYLAIFFALLPLIASLLFHLSPFPEMKADAVEKGKGKQGIGLALCVVCIFLGSAAENTMTNWISGFMENALQLPKAAGDIFGLAGFALLLALTRNVYAKYTPDITKVLLAGMVGAAACYIIIGLSSSMILSFIACILVGIFTSMLWPGTLILMEEKIPSVGVAAFALMAASGDMGASIAPQLTGILIDRIAASDFAQKICAAGAATPDEIGLKYAMLIIAIFPLLGALLVLYIRRFFKKSK